MDPAHSVSLGWAIPFALLLLSIAVLPLFAQHWWENNRNRAIVAAALSLPVVVWLFASGNAGKLPHAIHEYVSFIALLGSLFVISGGIYVDGDLRATPKVNAAFLAIGGVLASFIGTTGASMVLIRPLLRTNSERRHVVHTVVFFIFVVSNCGGLLTPLGDPPLFMGYLRGVPFDWTLGLWKEWLGVNAALIAIYYVWDSRAIRRETPAALRLDRVRLEPIRVQGGLNFLLLLGVVASVALITAPHLALVRDGAMVGLAVTSLLLTNRDVRRRNAFTWGPIVEVAVLFAGIFVTMIPALMYLEHHGRDLGVSTPARFFWVTGVLSSFLDNAPTYLTFTSVAASVEAGLHPGDAVDPADLRTILCYPEGHEFLRAISLGAVFMGANTYIGNGPNFMVKAIADASGVRMPTFFGYMLYSAGVLVPVLAVMSLLVF
jgi:Na+/H+ antiporter NhaD/arsenite permease-like protein